MIIGRCCLGLTLIKHCRSVDAISSNRNARGDKLPRFRQKEFGFARGVQSPGPGFKIKIAIQAFKLGLESADSLRWILFVDDPYLDGIADPSSRGYTIKIFWGGA